MREKISIIFLLSFILFVSGCLREPSPYQSRVGKKSGDNGFKIRIKGDPEKYIPGESYSVFLMGSRSYENIQYFQRFILNIESENKDKSPQKVGMFQLLPDALAKFNEDCVNTISEVNDLDKTEIYVMWTAPPAGSGCVTFRAMILQDARNWYADEGQLSKTLCEQTTKDIKFSEEDCCACDEAKYRVIFEGIWSNKTHPRDFPTSLWLTHFSDVIGASHVRNFSFWGEGHIATDGFRSLAEWGSPRLLESELKAKSKYMRTIIKAPGLWYPNVNANTSAFFKVDKLKHLVSLSSMLGPSPDWVVGVNGLNLCLKNCTWIENLTVDLFPWDAGTDSGISYMSPNAETNPREKMKPITTMYPEDPRQPFYDPTKKEIPPLARFYFTREKVVPRSCDEQFLNAHVDINDDNEEDASRPECAVTSFTEWSPCSVTCGKGLRMRNREYIKPSAQTLSCRRQLIFKEMCVADIPECDNKEQPDEESNELEDTEGICKITEWSSWNECSATCGIGFTMRTRRFYDRLGRKKCPHVILVEKEKCMSPPCQPHQIEVQDPICKTSDWSDWSPCSVTCGQGVRTRVRFLLVDTTKYNCQHIQTVAQTQCVEKADCNAVFDMFTAKEVCMQENEVGPCTGFFNRFYYEPRKEMCVPFIYGGCRGNRNNFVTAEECMANCGILKELGGGNLPIPSSPRAQENVDCIVTPWSGWSPCSVSCGVGLTERVRMIKVQAKNGGIPCPKKLTKLKKCVRPPCFN